MTTVRITLPDQLAAEASRAGLLSAEALERWLREQLKGPRVAYLAAAMDRMDAVNDPPPLLPEEISLEIAAMRAERRAQTKT